MYEVESLDALQDWLEDDKVLVDVWASYCQPCKRMEPIIREIDSEYSSLTIITVEADVQKDSRNYLAVSTVPTYIYFENGVERGRVVGAKPKRLLIKELGI